MTRANPAPLRNLATLGLLAASLGLLAQPAWAKLPAPSDEAKAAAAQAAAKTAWSGQVASYQLCQAMNRVAEHYRKTAKAEGRSAPAPVATPPCADPGPFVAPAAAPAGK